MPENSHKEEKMNEEERREWLVDSLTTEFLASLERGENPDPVEYCRRYPEIADELEANLLYFTLERKNLAQIVQSEQASEAGKRLQDPAARQRAAKLLEKFGGLAPEPPVTSLYKAAADRNIRPPQLAKTLGISSDILLALQQRTLKPAGIPALLVTRLARALELTAAQVSGYLAGPALASASFLNQDKPAEIEQQEFADCIRQSSLLSPAEKEFWLKEAGQ